MKFKYSSLRLTLLFLILFYLSPVCAELYPTKPITFVVTSSAGGGTDAMARLLAEIMSKDLGQPIVIENISGAGGAIGAGLVARAKPDGYKILFTTGSFITTPFLLPNAGYDPIGQFEGVLQLATVPLVIAARGSASINSLADLVSASKDGSQISFGSFGVGTPSHIAGEAINYYSDSRFTHIPYGGSSKIYPDLQSGILSIGIMDASFAIPMIHQGALKGLAVTGPKRLASVPHVPTLIELGIPFDLVGWYGVLVPKGTPNDVIGKLRLAFDSALLKPSVKERIREAGLGYVDGMLSPRQWTNKYQEEMHQWGELIKRVKISKE